MTQFIIELLKDKSASGIMKLFAFTIFPLLLILNLMFLSNSYSNIKFGETNSIAFKNSMTITSCYSLMALFAVVYLIVVPLIILREYREFTNLGTTQNEPRQGTVIEHLRMIEERNWCLGMFWVLFIFVLPAVAVIICACMIFVAPILEMVTTVVLCVCLILLSMPKMIYEMKLFNEMQMSIQATDRVLGRTRG